MRRKIPFWRVELFTYPFFKKDYYRFFLRLNKEEFVESLVREELHGRSRYVRVEDRRSAVERLFFGFFRRREETFSDLFDAYREIALHLFEFKRDAVFIRPYIWKSYFLCELPDVFFLWKYLDLLGLRDFWISLVVLGERVPLSSRELESIRFTPFPADFYTLVRGKTFYELHSHSGSFMHTKELWMKLLLAVSNLRLDIFSQFSGEAEKLRELSLIGYICRVVIAYPEIGEKYSSILKELERGNETAVSYLASRFLSSLKLKEEELLSERWVILRALRNAKESEILKRALYLYLWARTNFHRFFVFSSKEGLREFIYTFRRSKPFHGIKQRLLETKIADRRGFQPQEEKVKVFHEQRFSSDALGWLSLRERLEKRDRGGRGRDVLVVHLLRKNLRLTNTPSPFPFRI